MVRRRALRPAAALAGAAALGAAALGAGAAIVPAARAADARVAIGHYRWSEPVVHIDLHQHVTWYWVGPDTMHSVTGVSSNDLGMDSDPHTSEPMHRVGDTFQLTFDAPGVYQFRCKLHSIVHGEVIVSDVPGNPSDDPDPIPKPSISLTRPTLDDISLSPAHFTTSGTTINYALDDVASIDAEIWHLRGGHRGRYAGWQAFHGHIGFNAASFASPGRHYRPQPGRYVAYLQATDLFNNVSSTHAIRFTIHPPAHHRRHRRHHARRMRMAAGS